VGQYVKQVKSEDRVDPSTTQHIFDHGRLVGTWINTNQATRGITKLVVAAKDGKLFLRVFGAGSPEPHDWGKIEADVLYSDHIRSQFISAFTAQYHFDFAKIQLQANWNQGLLVVGSFSIYTDGSDRSNYFSREFFRQQGE